MNRLENELQKINKEWSILKRQWKATSGLWNDKAKRQFQQMFWEEFEHEIPAFIKGLKETTDVISKICHSLGIRI